MFATEDLISTMQISDKIVIGDAAGDDSQIIIYDNLYKGDWISFVEREEDNSIVGGVTLSERAFSLIKGYLGKSMDGVEKILDKNLSVLPSLSSNDKVELKSGNLSICDKKCFGSMTKESYNYAVRHGFSPSQKLMEMWGSPDDENKSDELRWFETAMHAVADSDEFPVVTGLTFGLFVSLKNKQSVSVVPLVSKKDGKVDLLMFKVDVI